MQTNISSWSYLAHFFLEWEMFQTIVVDKIKTHVLCSITFFFFFRKSCLYEIMWKNVLESGRPQMTIWRMRIACQIPKAANTQPQYVILIAFPLQQWFTNAPQCDVTRTLPVLFKCNVHLYCSLLHALAICSSTKSLARFKNVPF